MTKEEILKAEHATRIMNWEKVFLQNPSIIESAYAAMETYKNQELAAASAGKGFFRLVKASERLPENNLDQVFCNTNLGKEILDFENGKWEGDLRGTSDNPEIVIEWFEEVAVGKEQDGWIDVNDRLPEDGEIVLGYVKSEVSDTFLIEDIGYSFFDKGKWAKYDGEDKTVIYWQPLPQPPTIVKK